MKYDTYVGANGKKYYVPDRAGEKKLLDFLMILSKDKKKSQHIWHTTDVWIKGDDLYLEPVKGARKQTAVYGRQ